MRRVYDHVYDTFTTSFATPTAVLQLQQDTRSEFEMNLHEKLSDENFLSDIEPLIAPDTVWSFDDAAGYVQHDILPLLPGEPWRGGE